MNAEIGRVEADTPVILTTGTVPDRIDTQGARGVRRIAAWLLVAVAAVALVIGGFAFAFDRLHTGKILPGVDVAGVDVGGLDRAAAEDALRRSLPDLRAGAVTVEIGNDNATIRFADVGRDYDVDAMLDQALAAGRDTGLVGEVGSLVNRVSLPVQIKWDSNALAAAVTRLAEAHNVTAVDATITESNRRYVVSPAIEGRRVDGEPIYDAAAAIVGDPMRKDGTVTVQPTPVHPSISTMAAQSAVGRLDRVVAAPLTLRAGGESQTLAVGTLRAWVRLVEAGAGKWDLVFDNGRIRSLVLAVAPAVGAEPVDATFHFGSDGAKVVPSVDGRQLDVDAAVESIVGALTDRAEGSATETVNLAFNPLTADFSTADAQALADSVQVLGSWTTRFTPSPSNGKGVNIKTPARLIDGTVLAPGQMFDFVDAAGPFTRRNGYTDGAAIIHGNTKPDGVLGGGLCSASTTLFNAAAQAGLQIDERHNHAYYIGRYPVGLDATIWVNGRIRKSMQFTNDTEQPILIRATTTRRKVTFEIWGIPDGRTVSFSDARIEDEKEAKNYIEYTDELAPGVRERMEYRAVGFDSWVERTVTDSSGAVIHSDTFFSDYVKVDGIVEQGRFPEDPPAGTRVEAHGNLGV